MYRWILYSLFSLNQGHTGMEFLAGQKQPFFDVCNSNSITLEIFVLNYFWMITEILPIIPVAYTY